MGKPLKRIRTEVDRPRKNGPAGRPRCPIHAIDMDYNVDHMRWECHFDGCRQVAFPPEQIEQGKPIIGRGDIEVVRVDDPEGNKQGRTLLRAIDNNVMIDVTDILVHLQPGARGADVVMGVAHLTDHRTKR